MMRELRKNYSTHPRPSLVDDIPDGWRTTEVEQDFAITLLAFSWALLPVGFMLLMAIFTRYAQHRLTLAAVALLMLILAFASGAGQRRSSLWEPRMQLTVAALVSAAVSIGIVWGLELDEWWWVSYGLVFGAVANMYVSLNHLASCNAPVLRTPWLAKTPLPLDSMKNWSVQNGRWTNGRMGVFRFPQGGLCTMYGAVEGDATFLCLEPLVPLSELPAYAAWGLDFEALRDNSAIASGEE